MPDEQELCGDSEGQPLTGQPGPARSIESALP
jgi:hypothetical protein